MAVTDAVQTHSGQTHSGQTYCDRCGEPAREGDHAACRAARRMEPPRYCPACRRRLIVQVTPRGWTARCSQHGPVEDDATP